MKERHIDSRPIGTADAQPGFSRRNFLRLSTAAAVAAPFLSSCGTTRSAHRRKKSLGVNEKLQHASIGPNDFWWHLKIGELIYTTGEVPSTNIFAWTLPASKPFYYAAWLGELIFFLLHKIGSLELVIFSRNLLAGLFLVGLEARRRSDSWRIAALVTAIACLMITNNLPVRTQQWAWLPFIAFFSLLSRYSEKALPPRTPIDQPPRAREPRIEFDDDPRRALARAG